DGDDVGRRDVVIADEQLGVAVFEGDAADGAGQQCRGTDAVAILVLRGDLHRVLAGWQWLTVRVGAGPRNVVMALIQRSVLDRRDDLAGRVGDRDLDGLGVGVELHSDRWRRTLADRE